MEDRIVALGAWGAALVLARPVGQSRFLEGLPVGYYVLTQLVRLARTRWQFSCA